MVGKKFIVFLLDLKDGFISSVLIWFGLQFFNADQAYLLVKNQTSYLLVNCHLVREILLKSVQKFISNFFLC